MYYRIQNYIDRVRGGDIAVCREQVQLVDFVEQRFQTETLLINEKQVEDYLAYQKYFPFQLFEWEQFCFILHNCVYREDGELRWPILFIYVGRGAGKNGFLAFEDFCLLTPTNGVQEYNIDIFATSEDQAMTTFKDIYNVLEDNKVKMQKHFTWNMECIRNIKTRSELRFRTSAPRTKDGGRPGKVDFDEYHAYQDTKLIDVAVTGLGKKQYPRRTIITTDGDVRDGPLDKLLEKSRNILRQEVPDNGTLPFLCRLDDEKEITQKKNWPKANPSYPYLKTLQNEMELEFSDYLDDPVGNASFATKRMNCPQGDKETEVTDWKNIEATKREIPDLSGESCVGGIDYAKTTDFVAAGLLFVIDNARYWITHTWVCRQSPELKRIKAPLEEWEQRGLLTLVDDVEINPSYPAEWMLEQRSNYNIIGIGIDKYRYTLLAKALTECGFSANKKEYGNVTLIRPSNEMEVAPAIQSHFAAHRYIWGDNPLMRWYTNNTKQCIAANGNITYGKIEPKTRKTDGFKALVAAEAIADVIPQYSSNTFQHMFQFMQF